MLSPSDRRYRYPFINCTNCGPRFTIIKEIPYDRKNTTMAGFAMCKDYANEYNASSDKRYHSQPNACGICGHNVQLLKNNGSQVREEDLSVCCIRGPDLQSLKSNGSQVRSEDSIKDAIAFLKKGEIVAIKGLGGFYLACDATNDDAICRLRDRKKRERSKPFAIM